VGESIRFGRCSRGTSRHSKHTLSGRVDLQTGGGNTNPIVVDTTPGSIWRDSGGGYSVTQLLLEDLDGQLWVDVPTRGRKQLMPESETVFFGRADGSVLRFVRDNGRVVAFTVGSTRAERLP